MGHGLRPFARDYLGALRAYTRIPVTGDLAAWLGPGPFAPAALAAHHPGVGWLVGLCACAVFAAVSLALPATPATPLAAAVCCVAATMLLTGARHEREFAALLDRLPTGLGHIPPEPPAGNGVALTMILMLLAKLAFLAVLAARSPVAVLAALLGGQVLSRLWPLALARLRPGPTDRSQSFDALAATPTLLIALGWCAVPLALVGFAQGPAFLAAAALFSAAGAACIAWLAPPHPADMGAHHGAAVQQPGELGFYVGACMTLTA